MSLRFAVFRFCLIFRQKELENASISNFNLRDIIQPSMTCFDFIYLTWCSYLFFFADSINNLLSFHVTCFFYK